MIWLNFFGAMLVAQRQSILLDAFNLNNRLALFRMSTPALECPICSFDITDRSLGRPFFYEYIGLC